MESFHNTQIGYICLDTKHPSSKGQKNKSNLECIKCCLVNNSFSTITYANIRPKSELMIQLKGSSRNIKFSIITTLEILVQASPKDQCNLSAKFLTSAKGEMKNIKVRKRIFVAKIGINSARAYTL